MERKIHMYYHSQGRRDTVIQIADLYKTPMEAKSSCTFTLMAEGDKAECHVVQRQREFTHEIIEQ